MVNIVLLIATIAMYILGYVVLFFIFSLVNIAMIPVWIKVLRYRYEIADMFGTLLEFLERTEQRNK